MMGNEIEAFEKTLGVTNETCVDNGTPVEPQQTTKKTSPTSTADVIGDLSKALRIVDDDHLRYISESAIARQENEAVAAKAIREIAANAEKAKREIDASGDKINVMASAAEARFNDAYANLMDKAPKMIRANIEALAEAEIKGAIDKLLAPLNQSLVSANREAEKCESRLNQMSWNWRLFVGPIGTGILTAVIGSGLIYSVDISDMHRYANFGKRAAATIQSNYKQPKEQEAVFNAFGGRP